MRRSNIDPGIDDGSIRRICEVAVRAGEVPGMAKTIPVDAFQNFYGVRVQDYAVRLTHLNVETVLGAADLVVDCFDNAGSRQLVQDFVRAHDKACLHGGLAADGGFGVVRWDEDFAVDAEDVPGQATCEGAGFLPLIATVGAALVRSIRDWMEDGTRRNWNVSPASAESF